MTKENKASDGPLISNFNVQRNHEKLIKSAYAQESCPEILVSMSNVYPGICILESTLGFLIQIIHVSYFGNHDTIPLGGA